MFRNHLAAVLIAGVISMAPALALAGEFDEPGFYLGAGAAVVLARGLEEQLDVVEPNEISRRFRVGSGYSIGARGGYRLIPRAALEIQFDYLGKPEVLDTVLGLKGHGSDAVVMTLNTRGYLMTGQIQPYALVGVGFQHDLSLSSTEVAMRFGGGFEAYLNSHVFLDVGVSYLLPFSSLKDLATLAIGGSIGYKF